MKVQDFLNTILCPHQYDKTQSVLREKIITANIIMLVFGVVLFAFTLLRYTESHYIQSAVDGILFISIILSYILLYKDKNNLLLVSRILIFFATLTSITLIVSIPEVDTRFAWISVCIYMMFFLLDLREGIYWFLAMIFIIIVFYLTDVIHLSISEFIIFFLSTTVFALLLSRYEKIKKDSERYFRIHAKELKNAVKEKTNELQAQKDMFETLFQKSFDGIFLIENSKFIECNDAIVEMLGYTKKEDLLNTHPAELSPKHQADGTSSQEKADEMIRICFEKGSNNFEWIHQKANGINFWCDITLTHLTLHNRDLIHVVLRDISYKKALELENKKINENLEEEVKKRTHELEVAMRTKSDFLANMSHEVRTPLNAILGFIDILSRDEKDARKKEYLNIIHTSSQGLLTVINDILDFSKIESGKLELHLSPFETTKPFEEIQMLFFEKAKEKNINCKINILSSLPERLLGDTLRIKQILSNLVSNAIKFTPKDGNVSINVSYNQETSILQCCVKDTGIGISNKNLKNIFTSFTQADSSTTRSFGGTGLGLSISKLLVELMGGNISVKSIEDEGSEFCFQILVHPSIVLAEEILEEKNEEFTNIQLQGKALVVEDNKTNQILINLMLEELGIESDTVDNGLEALNQVEKESYDIILMDENMPVMNGIESTKRIRALDMPKYIPIIAVTANALKGDKERFLAAGMDEYISKPIDSEKFVTILKRYLEQSK